MHRLLVSSGPPRSTWCPQPASRTPGRSACHPISPDTCWAVSTPERMCTWSPSSWSCTTMAPAPNGCNTSSGNMLRRARSRPILQVTRRRDVARPTIGTIVPRIRDRSSQNNKGFRPPDDPLVSIKDADPLAGSRSASARAMTRYARACVLRTERTPSAAAPAGSTGSSRSRHGTEGSFDLRADGIAGPTLLAICPHAVSCSVGRSGGYAHER